MRRPVKALVFDLDGTIADTLDDLTIATNHALSQMGREPIGREVVQAFVGDGARELIQRALGGANGELVESGLGLFTEYYEEHNGDAARPYEGIEEMLDLFRDKPMAILSNKPHRFVKPLIDRMNLNAYFRIVRGGEPGVSLKPAPDALIAILDQLAVPPSAAVMVGDSENDILAGRAAGTITCAVTYGFRSRTTLETLAPDYVIDSAQQLGDLFC